MTSPTPPMNSEIPEAETCNECAGSGYNDHTHDNCPTCGGSGLYGYIYGQHMSCSDCNGTGQIQSPANNDEAKTGARTPSIPDKDQELAEILQSLWGDGYNAGTYNARRKGKDQVDFWNPDVRADRAKAQIEALYTRRFEEALGEDYQLPQVRSGLQAHLYSDKASRNDERAGIKARWNQHKENPND